VGFTAEVKKFVVLGFGEVEGIKTPAPPCLKFITSFCECSIIPSSGYRE
jgi:hypothetical protein